MIDSKLLGQKRKMDAPPLDAREGKKAKPQPPPSASQARPPPPKRPSSSSPRPPPPPKPSQPHTNTPQKPAGTKPAPPRRQNSKDEQQQAQKQTPHKGESSSKPVTWQSSDGSTQASSLQQQKDITEQLQNQSVKPSVKLPTGWICVWSKNQKRWYFFDTSTNKSVWDPRLIGK